MNAKIRSGLGFFNKTVLAVAVSAALAAGSFRIAASAALPSAVADPNQVRVANNDEVYIDTFYSYPDHTYCDVRLLAAYWGVSEWETKIGAGQKIVEGNMDILRDVRQAARNQARANNGPYCDFEDADNPPYSYDDAEVLARYWGEPTPWDAKVKIGGLLMEGGNVYVQQSLADALQRGY